MSFRSRGFASARVAAVLSILLGVAGLCAANMVFAADAAAGQAAYALCASCHGASGEGNLAMNSPKLAGQGGWYIRRQREAYQNGTRGTATGDTFGMQMRPMAMTIAGPDAVENLIAYITTLADTLVEATVTGDVAAGKIAYAVCAACHGQAAEGNEQLGGPRLVGQNDWYLIRQIANYNDGLRGYDPSDIFGNQMRPMAMTINGAKAANDVVAYINSLR